MGIDSAAPSEQGRFLNRKSLLPEVVSELAVLLDLDAVSRHVGAGREIISEGKRCRNVFLLTSGIAIRYRILRDGQRQILNFLLPGDFAGVTSCRFDHALYTVKTLAPSVVAPVPVQRLLGLFETHPQLAAKLFWSFAGETAILAEHLIAVGRRTAAQRIAHLLLELHGRLRRIGLAGERSYRLPLTQEMISDALGLSIPYVNRVLQQLRLDRLVTIKDQLVVIDNMEELAALADFEQLYLQPLSIAEAAADAG
ncbi:MAG: Crp/Fnr family transcriptional regulator [Thiohalocapsa sp.]